MTTRRTWDRAHPIAAAGGFTLELDRKPLRLPNGALLNVPTMALAEEIAREWLVRGMGEEVRATDIPLTRLAGFMQGEVAREAGPLRILLLRYAETDLLCYRAREPSELVARETELWQPWIDWAAMELRAVLKITSGVMPLRQDPAALAALRASVDTLDAPGLAALRLAVPAMGSLVLGLALAAGRITSGAAAAAALVEETFQTSVWGEDAEAAKRRRAVAADVALAERFLELARA